MVQDLRYAFRALGRTPGFTLVALLAVALGIGANTAIFSFVDVMLLRPLPYPGADRIYATVSINPGRGLDRASIGYADYQDWRREKDLFEAVAVYQPGAASISGGSGDPERAEALSVSDDFFRVVQVTPVLGRTLGATDNTPNAPRVTVITHALWQRRFASDPAVIGKDLRIGGVPHQVVGVLGPRAAYPEDTQLFLPIVPSRFGEADLARRDNLIFQGIARLLPTTSRAQADARLLAIAARVEHDHPESRKGWSNGLVPLREYIVEPELTTALYVLLAAVAAVLLIACANLANLTLIRGAGRAREMGVRLALGAKRGRLIRQLATESAIVGVAGGTVGVLMAAAAVPVLIALVPADTPFVGNVGLDGRVLLTAALLTCLTVIAVGVLPALNASRADTTGALKDGARGATQGRKTTTLRSTLVVAEIALAVVLLVTAGLLVRSLTEITRTSPGADIDRVLAARVGVPGSRYTVPQRVDFFRRLLSELERAPGVHSAAITSYLPAGGGGFGLGRVFLSEGQSEPPATNDVAAMWSVVSPHYFQTLGIALLRGRAFEDRDHADAAPVIIVSQSFAEKMFPNQDPVGRRVRSWRDENVYREIVGVASEVAFSSLTDRDSAVVYVPHAQQGWGGMTIALRATAGAPERLTSTLRLAVRTLDPELPLANVGTMAVFARDSVARERLSALLMTALGALALALAVLGVYATMSYAVVLRRQELGVRLALGAAPRDLYRLVLERGLFLTFAGLTFGLLGALAASQGLKALLYQTSPFDPVVFGAIAGILSFTGFVACVLPARRAATSDPLIALRAD